MKGRKAFLLGLATLTGIIGLGAPLLPNASPNFDAALALTVPIALVLLLNGLLSDALGSRQIAVVSALIAVGATLRVLSPGVAGLEPLWLVVLIGGCALGAAEGFATGVGVVLAGAIATGGVGPWLPYQLTLAGWIGMGAGLLPRVRPGAERWVLAIYGAVATFGFGWAMNLWFWPTAHGLQPGLGYDPTDSLLEHLLALARFSIATSLPFDIPRATFTAVLTLIAAPRLLRSVRRIARPATAEA